MNRTLEWTVDESGKRWKMDISAPVDDEKLREFLNNLILQCNVLKPHPFYMKKKVNDDENVKN